MRALLLGSALLLTLSACNTVDGIGKDMGAVGQSFGDLFDGSVRHSRAARGAPMGVMMPSPQASMPQQQPMGMGAGMNNGMPPMGNAMPPMGRGYGHSAPTGGMSAAAPQYPPYGGHHQQRPAYGQGGYSAAPQPPAMPYYYNQGY